MKNFDLKTLLKNFKLNESNISMALGALVIIVVGVLVVNYFKGSGGDLLTGLTDQNTETLEENQYKVAKGDTLWSIAETKYGSGFEWTKIAEANNLTDSNIEEGQVLTLPEVETAAVTEETESEVAEVASPTPTVVASPEATTSPVITTSEDENGTSITSATYTVVHGDNLWDISVRAYGDGYKWTEIARENNLLHPNLIHAGNVLILPR